MEAANDKAVLVAKTPHHTACRGTERSVTSRGNAEIAAPEKEMSAGRTAPHSVLLLSAPMATRNRHCAHNCLERTRGGILRSHLEASPDDAHPLSHEEMITVPMLNAMTKTTPAGATVPTTTASRAPCCQFLNGLYSGIWQGQRRRMRGSVKIYVLAQLGVALVRKRIPSPGMENECIVNMS